MKTLLSIARADWAPALRAAAGRVAYVVACAIVAAELVYRAGIATGRAVHWLSDRLGGLASGRYDRAQTARAVVGWAHAVLAPEPALVEAEQPHRMYQRVTLAKGGGHRHEWLPVTMAPVAAAAPPLETLTVAQLRKLARARGMSKLARNGRRADLISALV